VSTFAFEPGIPILRIFDETRARAFYIDYVGFAVDFEHRFEPGMPLYCGVSRGALKLHLSEHAGDAAPAARVFIPMNGIDAFWNDIRQKDWQPRQPEIDTRDWGREVTLIVPFHNRLTFCEMTD
jgi:hypothetical protein